MTDILIRPANISDYKFVTNLMENTLSRFYDGDHIKHAQRIFDAHNHGGFDKVGFFSLKQVMFIAEFDGTKVGMIHLVLKRQSTCKISPLIVTEKFKKRFGIGKALIKKAIQFAHENNARQLYCTVSEKNQSALKFFIRNSFTIAGTSKNHYKADTNEYMLYRNLVDDINDDEFDKDHISVLPMQDEQHSQVRKLLLENLPQDFLGIDNDWIDALFAGHKRQYSRDVNQKYKIIYTATNKHDEVIGVVGATPKKGEPIKLMPLVATEPTAFFALLADTPNLLRDFGRKVYVHLTPSSEQVRFLQKAGWRLDSIFPDAYQLNRLTQQWSLEIEGDELVRHMRLKKKYLDFIDDGTKTLEVRVGYENIKKIEKGDQILFKSRYAQIVKDVFDIRKYNTFEEMLQTENYQRIVPEMDETDVKKLLKDIYPADKESLGVIVFEIR